MVVILWGMLDVLDMAGHVGRLDDFENSCAAYDKALELSDDYLTHLNYAVTL